MGIEPPVSIYLGIIIGDKLSQGILKKLKKKVSLFPLSFGSFLVCQVVNIPLLGISSGGLMGSRARGVVRKMASRNIP